MSCEHMYVWKEFLRARICKGTDRYELHSLTWYTKVFMIWYMYACEILWIYVCVLGPVDHWWLPARPPNLETLIAQKNSRSQVFEASWTFRKDVVLETSIADVPFRSFLPCMLWPFLELCACTSCVANARHWPLSHPPGKRGSKLKWGCGWKVPCEERQMTAFKIVTSRGYTSCKMQFGEVVMGKLPNVKSTNTGKLGETGAVRVVGSLPLTNIM